VGRPFAGLSTSTGQRSFRERRKPVVARWAAGATVAPPASRDTDGPRALSPAARGKHGQVRAPSATRRDAARDVTTSEPGHALSPGTSSDYSLVFLLTWLGAAFSPSLRGGGGLVEDCDRGGDLARSLIAAWSRLCCVDRLRGVVMRRLLCPWIWDLRSARESVSLRVLLDVRRSSRCRRWRDGSPRGSLLSRCCLFLETETTSRSIGYDDAVKPAAALCRDEPVRGTGPGRLSTFARVLGSCRRRRDRRRRSDMRENEKSRAIVIRRVDGCTGRTGGSV